MLSDEDIWDVVQRMRKERRKQLRNENGVVYRFVNWVKSKRGNNQQPTLGNNRIESFTSGSSSGDDNMIDRESSSITDSDAAVAANDDNVAENDEESITNSIDENVSN